MYVQAACEVFAFAPTIHPAYLVAFGVIAVILLLLRVFSKYQERQEFLEKKRAKKSAEQTIDRTPELIHHMRLNIGPDRKELKQISLFFGFSDAQNECIKNLCAQKKINHPGQIFSDYGSINQLIGERLAEIQAMAAPTKETETEKTVLFLIRETVENRKKAGKRITSSRMVPEKQGLALTLQEGEQHHVELVSNSAAGLVCTVPKDQNGAEIRIPLWTRATVFFTTQTEQSYRFPSRVIKYDTDLKSLRLVLAHTDAIEAMPDRAHNRKTLNLNCRFSPVTVGNVVNGKKTERKFYPAKNSFEGTLLDISAGGCSIQSRSSLKTGEYTEIHCILERQTEDSMTGKVVRISESDSGPVMHIQFAKVPRTTMNRIFAYIFTDGEKTK